MAKMVKGESDDEDSEGEEDGGIDLFASIGESEDEDAEEEEGDLDAGGTFYQKVFSLIC